MMRYRLTSAAEADLGEIIAYISRDDPAMALKILDQIERAIHKLAAVPGMGHLRPDITSRPVRFWAVHSWLIVYRVTRKRLEVIRIVHGARELTRLLEPDRSLRTARNPS
jgi:plasmid stabilization system protein ParE